MWNPEEDDEQDDYLDDGIEINSAVFDDDLDNVAVEQNENDDSDRDAAEHYGY